MSDEVKGSRPLSPLDFHVGNVGALPSGDVRVIGSETATEMPRGVNGVRQCRTLKSGKG